MRRVSKMLVWFAVVSALGAGVGAALGTEKNVMEAWNTFFNHYERIMWGQNEADNVGIYDRENNPEQEQRLKTLRIQHVENQILRKLRLKERPRPAASARGSLPLPVKDGETMLQTPHPNDHDRQDPHSDDFYGKTDQKVIFPDDVKELGKCDGHLSHPAACFTFTMPNDLQPEDVSSTELWIYKEKDPLDKYNQTILVFETMHWDYSRLYRKTRPVAIHETFKSEGWIKVNIGWVANGWLDNSMTGIEISCLSCGGSPKLPPISLVLDRRPFLVFNTKFNAKKRRVRHLECNSGTSECCRERLYISFAELGWDDWILQPRGYHAYFCRGSCNSVAAITLSGSHHYSVLKKLFHTNHPKRLELKPCCTPTTFSSLQLFYMDSNNTVTQKTLPNMIVESCGCM